MNERSEYAAEAAEPDRDRRVLAMERFVAAEQRFHSAVRDAERQQKAAAIAEMELAKVRAELHNLLGMDSPDVSERTTLSDGSKW